MISILLLTATLGVAAPPQTPPPQQPHFTRPSEFSSREPLWVPIRSAITTEGTLRDDLFSSSSRAALSAQVHVLLKANGTADSANECQGATAVFGQFPESGPDKTLTDLARSALRIASGTVRSSTVGIFEGVAGSLLEFVPDDQLKGHFAASPVFIFYPYARHREGRVAVCRSDPRYTLRPAVGDRLLFFALYPSRDTADSLFEPGPTHVMIKAPDGGLSTTRAYRDASTPSSFQDVLTRVRRLIEAETR